LSSSKDKKGSPTGDHPGLRAPALRVLGDFEIRREIGRGGMGVVYEAWQRSLHRLVALKVLDRQIGASQVAVARFQREAQAAAKLHHPHIVPIYAQGVEDSAYYYAMELVEGPSVHALLGGARSHQTAETVPLDLDETVVVPRTARSGHQTAETAVVPRTYESDRGEQSGHDSCEESGDRKVMNDSNILLVHDSAVRATPDVEQQIAPYGSEYFRTVARHIADVAGALAYAHEEGVIHRDIKPHNLLLGRDGRLRISDFGLARLAEQPGVTMTGEMVGSPLYMSPEQIMGAAGEVDARTDIYSLGATLYEWLALTPPYPGDTRERVISLIMSTEPPPLRSHNPRIPIALETICTKALERDRDRRYQSAAELRDDLVRFLESKPIKAKRAGLANRALKSLRRHQVAAVVAAAVIGGGALLAALFSKQSQVRTQAQVAAQAQDQAAEILDILGQSLPFELAALMRGAEAVQGMVDPKNLGLSGGAASADAPRPKAAVGTPSSIASRVAREYYRATLPADRFGALNAAAGEDDKTLANLREADNLWNEGKLERAKDLLDAYLAMKPNDVAARQMHAALCAELGLYKEVAEDAAVMVRLDSQSTPAYLWRGIAYLLMDQIDSAMVNLSWASDLDRKSPWAKVMLGLGMIRNGRAIGAVIEFEDALREDPTMMFALLGRASAYFAVGQFDRAVADATGVLDREPENVDALTIRGDAYASLNNFQDAAADYDRAMEIVGKTPALGLRYLSVLVQQQQMAKSGTDESGKQPTAVDAAVEESSKGPSAVPLLDWISNLARPPAGERADRSPGTTYPRPRLPGIRLP
jgi:serine/threonine protein kinase